MSPLAQFTESSSRKRVGEKLVLSNQL